MHYDDYYDAIINASGTDHFDEFHAATVNQLD